MTKFKAGDKVRLVGEAYNQWGLAGQTGEILAGGRNATVYVSSERMKLNVCPGWEVELIEEETKFEDVQVGDRVRLTAANGDVAEFTVKQIRGKRIDSEYNYFCRDHFEKVEILTRAKEPLVPGLYENEDSNKFYTLLPDGRAFFTCHGGSWIPAGEEGVRRVLRDEGSQWTRRIDL